MKSKITKIFDYRQTEIPSELRCWRIKDEEIAHKMEVLAQDHAREEDVEQVESGDSVACQGKSEITRWNRPVLLFYPGRGLCESELENACVGARKGETVTVSLAEGEVSLTVTRIV